MAVEYLSIIGLEIENIDAIKSFVKSNLHNEIEALERRRKLHYKHSQLSIIFYSSLLLHVPIFFIGSDLWRMIAHQITFLINLIFSYLVFFRFRSDERIYHDYRKKIIPKLLSQINSKFRYYPRGKILAKEFVSSGLYYNKINRLTRKDLVLGMVKKAAFSMSYVKAQTKEFAGRSGVTDASKSVMITRFQGLHYVFRVPLTFMGKTIILPLELTEHEEVNEINEFNLHKRKSKNTPRIKTGNSVFDRKFAVFTSNEREARRFLSENRINDLLEINQLFSNTVALSFFGNAVFLHAHTNSEVFKLDVNKPIDVDHVADNYFNLRIALAAVDILLR